MSVLSLLFIIAAADVPGVDQVRGHGAAPGEGAQDGEPGTAETLCLRHLQGEFISLLPHVSETTSHLLHR